MKQFKRTILRTILDILYTIFLPILPSAILYSIQRIRDHFTPSWVLFLIWLIFALLIFYFTFFKNSIHFEIDNREIRYYKFGKLIQTFPLDEYEFSYDSHITSTGIASLQFCAEKEGKEKKCINTVGLGEAQVKDMISWIAEMRDQKEE